MLRLRCFIHNLIQKSASGQRLARLPSSKPKGSQSSCRFLNHVMYTPFLFSMIAASLCAENENYDDQYEQCEANNPFIADQRDEEREVHLRFEDANSTMYSSAQPLLSHDFGIILSGDYLYWKIGEGGLDYALRSNVLSGSLLHQAYQGVRGNPSKIHHHYHSGYRLGLDIQLPREGWDLQGIWTRYQANSHSSVSSDTGLLWNYYMNNNQALELCNLAKAKWKLNYNVLDTNLGRSYFIGKYLSIRPSFGFRAAWIEQQLNINYIRITLGLPGNFRSHNRNNFVGYGMVAGLQTLWPLKYGFCLFGNAAASLLWSRFKVAQFERNPDHTPRSHLSDRLYLTTAEVDMQGGLKWSTHFFKNKLYFDVHAGWEEQVWFNQNQLNFFTGNSFFGAGIGKSKNQQQNLTFSGWTIGTQLGF